MRSKMLWNYKTCLPLSVDEICLLWRRCSLRLAFPQVQNQIHIRCTHMGEFQTSLFLHALCESVDPLLSHLRQAINGSLD